MFRDNSKDNVSSIDLNVCRVPSYIWYQNWREWGGVKLSRIQYLNLTILDSDHSMVRALEHTHHGGQTWKKDVGVV